jgi:hypothetical protein
MPAVRQAEGGVPMKRTALSEAVRQSVLARDGNCCARCGVNVLHVEEAFQLVAAMHDRKPWSYPSRKEFARACGYGDGSHTWETNHTVAVVEGGTNDEAALETLCIPCHRVHTNGVVKRRAKFRRVVQKFVKGKTRGRREVSDWHRRRAAARNQRRREWAAKVRAMRKARDQRRAATGDEGRR